MQHASMTKEKNRLDWKTDLVHYDLFPPYRSCSILVDRSGDPTFERRDDELDEKERTGE